jgi:sugar fermentation stimulation protein A
VPSLDPDRFDHAYPTPLEDAVLVRRYKRFLADVERPDGSQLTVHCANPGAMTGCNEAGQAVRIRDSGNPQRKLPYSLEQVRAGEAWVCVNTALPNLVVAGALARQGVPGLEGYGTIRSEVAEGSGSRVDFLLEEGPERCWVEVKSVTLVTAEEARFPDAVTLRGRKHLEALRARVEAGERALMLYLVGRADGRLFRPAWEIDPGYAETLQAVVDVGVEVLPLRMEVARGGLRAGPVLPYDLAHA